MKKWMMALAATCAAAVMVLSGCGNTPSVHVTKAAISTEPFTLETKAAPEALHTAPVIPSVSGGLISNPPDIGATVKAGDVLFKIDASQYEAQASALQQKIAESSAQAAPVYNGPSVDNSLEASLLKQGIITKEKLCGHIDRINLCLDSILIPLHCIFHVIHVLLHRILLHNIEQNPC